MIPPAGDTGKVPEPDKKPPTPGGLDTALKYWPIILLLFAGVGTALNFTAKFAALSKEVELLRAEVKACEEGHPTLQEDIHAATRSVEQLRCEVQDLAFDFGSLKCSSSPGTPFQTPPSSQSSQP